MIELFLAITTGATLLILPRSFHANPRKLFSNLFLHRETKINFLQMSPSVFLRFSQEEIQYIFHESSLQILCLGGEHFPSDIVLNRHRKNDLRLFNFYGITEVSCWASICEVKKSTEIVTLGIPLADTVMEVRDENGCCIQEGIGEMFIGKIYM